MDYESSDNQVGISSLGIAFEMSNIVEKVTEQSPADKAGIKPGDVIIKAKINVTENEEMKKLKYPQKRLLEPIEFSDQDKKGRNWPALMLLLQQALPGSTVDLTYQRNDKEFTAKKIEWIESVDWFNSDRGFLFEPLEIDRKIESLGDAISIGYGETLDSLTLVYRTLNALGTARVSPRLIGGPWMIANVAAAKADEGNAVFLLFLTMLSANLAVLNFLPIPVLDGGHFVLLAYEGIRGKPANEHVQTVLAYIGLILILALMVWACILDFHVIPRW
jgi:regulator of sigma E protease